MWSSSDFVFLPKIQTLVRSRNGVCFTSQYHIAGLNVCLILGIIKFWCKERGLSGASEEVSLGESA